MSEDLGLRARAGFQVWRQARPDILAVDTETYGLNFYDPPFAVTIAWLDEPGHYFDLRAFGAKEAIGNILMEQPRLVFHNANFDVQKLILAGLLDPKALPDIHDTEILAHLVDEHQPLALKGLARDLLGLQTDEDSALGAWFKEHKIKKAERQYGDLPPELLIPYAIKDAEFTSRLFRYLYPMVVSKPDLYELYELERALTITLVRMSRAGLKLDMDYLQTTARQYARRAFELELEIKEMTNEHFNANSPKQITEAFAERGVDLPDTTADTLAGLDDPLAALITELRTVHKIHGTYLLNLIEEQRDGLAHPNFRQNGTRTGRMSSGSAAA